MNNIHGFDHTIEFEVNILFKKILTE